jgi:hypothetical protein
MWDMMEVYDKSEARGWPTIGDGPQSMAILIMDIHEGSSIHLIDIISIYIYIIYPMFPR